MLFVRSATYAWHSILRHHPNGPIRIIGSKPPLRCSSSSLPDKKDSDDGAPNQELVLPKEKWDPVAQKFLKMMPVEHHGIEPAAFNDYTIWYPIYKFPYLAKVYAFMRFKAYVTLISLGVSLFEIADFLVNTHGTPGYAALVSGITLFSMCMAGNLCRKLIVQIYTTEDLEYVRFSRFTFFARRQDIVLPRSVLVPLTDSNSTHRKLVLTLEVKSPKNVDLSYDNYEFYDERYNIVLMFDGIHNEEKFETILGKLLRRIH